MNEIVISIVTNIFSSIIYDVPSNIIKDKISNNVAKKIENQIRQGVEEVLENMQQQSNIFDTDAMQSYLKNMKPIEKIYKHIFQPSYALGKTLDSLIIELSNHTIEYLTESDKNVGVMEKRDITEFYKRISRVCNSVSHSLIEPENMALANLLNQNIENNYKKTEEYMASKSDLSESTENIIKEVRQLHHKESSLSLSDKDDS